MLIFVAAAVKIDSQKRGIGNFFIIGSVLLP